MFLSVHFLPPLHFTPFHLTTLDMLLSKFSSAKWSEMKMDDSSVFTLQQLLLRPSLDTTWLDLGHHYAEPTRSSDMELEWNEGLRAGRQCEAVMFVSVHTFSSYEDSTHRSTTAMAVRKIKFSRAKGDGCTRNQMKTDWTICLAWATWCWCQDRRWPRSPWIGQKGMKCAPDD